jgi:hypothetical protein
VDTVDREHLCYVCGFDLGFRPWDGPFPSDEICPCCGIQFGYHDAWAAASDEKGRTKIYAKWREDWIAAGMPWRGRGEPAPQGWNPSEQLKRVGSGG